MPQLATICYIDNGKEFLMLHRNKKPNDVHEGKWIGVGGKLERGETPQECAAREIFEETGLRAKPVLKGIITFPEFTPDLDWYTYVFKDFLSIRWEVFSDLYNFLSFNAKITDLIQASFGIHYATIFNDNHCILLYS